MAEVIRVIKVTPVDGTGIRFHINWNLCTF